MVKFNNKWGVINKEGIEVIPLIYDFAIRYGNRIAVKLNNKCGFIDIDNLSVFNEFMNYIVNIGSRSDTLYYQKYKDTYLLKTGCFFGSLEDFETAVEKEYGSDKFEETPLFWIRRMVYLDYMKVINELKTTL